MESVEDIRLGTILMPRGGGDQYCEVIEYHCHSYNSHWYVIRNIDTRRTKTMLVEEILEVYEPNNDNAMKILFGISNALPKGKHPLGGLDES